MLFSTWQPGSSDAIIARQQELAMYAERDIIVMENPPARLSVRLSD